MKLIFLIYTFFRTSVQKIGDGYFFFSKGFGLADIWPEYDQHFIEAWIEQQITNLVNTSAFVFRVRKLVAKQGDPQQ